MTTLTNNLLVRALKSPELDILDPVQVKKNQAVLLDRVRKLTKEQREELSASLDEIRFFVPSTSAKPLTERGVAVLLLTDDEKVGYDKDYETIWPGFVAKTVDALSNAALMEKISETRTAIARVAALGDIDVESVLTGKMRQLTQLLEGRTDISQEKLDELNRWLSASEQNFKAIKWDDSVTFFDLHTTLLALSSAVRGEAKLAAILRDCHLVLNALRISETPMQDLESELQKIGLNPQEIQGFFSDISKLSRGKNEKELVQTLIGRFVSEKLNAMKQSLSEVESKQKHEVEQINSEIRILTQRLGLYQTRRAIVDEKGKVEAARAAKKQKEGELQKLEFVCRLIDKILQKATPSSIIAALGTIPITEHSIHVRHFREHLDLLIKAVNGDVIATGSLAGALHELDALKEKIERRQILEDFRSNNAIIVSFDEEKKLEFILANIQYLKAVFENKKAETKLEIKPDEPLPQPVPAAPVAPALSPAPQPSPAPAPALTAPSIAPVAQSAALQPSPAPAPVEKQPAPAAKKGPFVIARNPDVTTGHISGLQAVIKFFKEADKEKKSNFYQQIGLVKHGALAEQIYGAFYQILKKNKKLAGPVFGKGDEHEGESKDPDFGKAVFHLSKGAFYKDKESKNHSIATFEELNKFRLLAMEQVLEVYQEKK